MKKQAKRRQTRVALYARQDVPLHPSDNMCSLAGQLADMRGVAQEYGRTVVVEYRDYGQIGGDQPGFRALNAAARRRAFDEIYVARLSAAPGSLTREELLFHLLMPLLAHDVEVFVYDVPSWATERAESEYLDHALAPLLDWAHDVLVAPIRERQQQLEALGITSAAAPVYGYRLTPGSDRVSIIPEQIAAVQQIFAACADGHSGDQVAEMLNAGGYRNLTGGRFSAAAVREVVSNSHYARSLHCADGLGDSGTPEPLIPRELWCAANRRLASEERQLRAARSVAPVAAPDSAVEGGTGYDAA